MRTALVPILALATLCVSCSHSAPPPAQPPAADKPKTVLDEQLKALDKAKAVQGVIDQEKKDMDKKLEDAGG